MCLQNKIVILTNRMDAKSNISSIEDNAIIVFILNTTFLIFLIVLFHVKSPISFVFEIFRNMILEEPFILFICQ
jgi:hypothetical protein